MTMALAVYRRKRDFRKTKEPPGKKDRRAEGRSFVVHEHAASHHHFDLRLEWDGVLKSWAVPKGPSLDPLQKRLAIQVEDHPLDYGSFEGTIPAGQYGAGEVLVWDRGTWIPNEDPRKAQRKGHLKFELRGRKLHGHWSLVRTKRRPPGEKSEWLLLKKADPFARPLEEGDVLENSKSVKTGSTMKQRSATSGQGGARAARGTVRTKSPRAAGKRTSLPRWIAPELATLVKQPPLEDEWIHEIKFDGYRILARLHEGKAALFTRSGLDWTRRFPTIAAAVAGLPARSALLDGEIVVLDRKGVSRFQDLQSAIRDDQEDVITYFAFDLLHLGGRDLRELPLEERKQQLAKLLRVPKKNSVLRVSEHIVGDGERFFARACVLGLEGIVSKRRGTTYRSGRVGDWRKTKCTSGQEFVIVGYTDPSGGGSGIGALLLGVRNEDGELRSSGRVGTGFSTQVRLRLRRRLERLERAKTPLVDPPRSTKGVHWVRPELVAEVSFTEWTKDGRLRHPSFRGLREDKSSRAVVRERAPDKSPVALTHPDRILYPETGLTKKDLAAYYKIVAERMLPEVAGRPLSLLRCPEGRSGACFFQKHLKGELPEGIVPLRLREKTGVFTSMTIASVEGLVALVQLGALEIHVWGARKNQVERPDRVVFDLDPGPGVPWASVVETAHELRRRLAKQGLVSFVKTTGGKGLHVVTPIAPRYDWERVRAFSRDVGDKLAADFPDQYVTTISKAKRRGKILIDTLRNTRGATWVAPYSSRARPGATVSMPVSWSQLVPKLSPDSFTVASLLRGKKPRGRDPWAALASTRQLLPRVR